MCMCIYVYRNEKMKSLCFILKKKIVLNGLYIYIYWGKKARKSIDEHFSHIYRPWNFSFYVFFFF